MPRRKQGRRNFEEQEAANSLLQLAHKNVQPSNEGSAIEPLQVPNKRGRKPKVKKALPVLMRKSKKVYSNYQKCYTDKMPEIANSGQNAQIDDKLDWGKSFPGFNPDFHNRTPAQAVQICDSLSSDPDEGQSNQARIVKSSNSECWSSIVVSQSSKEDDDDVKSTCSNESTISANSDSVSLSATPLQSCSFDSLPRNWLPLKKRRLLVEEPESMLTKEWQPPSPESLQGSPLLGSLSCTETGETATSSKKMSILEQACISAGIEKFDDSSNDVQVMFEGVKSTSIPFYGVSHKRQRQMAYQPGRGAQFTPTAMPPIARPVAVRPAVYPDPAMCRPYNLSKPTVQLSDQQPLNLCSKSEALRLLNMDFMRNSAAPFISPTVSYPQLKSQVYFRILSDNWRMQPKCSVYEIQPYHCLGLCPPYMVSIFVLIHKERSETKSLHFLNRFPSLGQIKFEYLHSVAIHPLLLRGGMKLPNHLLIQHATEDQFFSSDGMEILQNQFPGSAIFTVIEDNLLVVNKIAVSEVFAHSKAILCVTSLTKTTYDPWIHKSIETVEVYRLTIPAWMFFSREVIRLHNTGFYPRL
ncbi:uncharacterized protein LOC135942275 isoform X2 [Cloeon dipterum]|uniref:uncharacterized protein LOC135942275 isoform X2 n=1 Tax=Cloeon dipterum TaxID=197152 RepID=UPI0032203484